MIRLLPRKTHECTLQCQDELPIEQRITWQLRVMTGAESIDYAEALAATYRVSDVRGQVEATAAVILRVAVGWNVAAEDGTALPLSADSLRTALSQAELWQVARDIPHALTLSELDKKKSPSPSPSAGAGSAESPAPSNAASSTASTAAVYLTASPAPRAGADDPSMG